MRMRGDALDGAAGGDQGLTDHLPAEYARPAGLRRAAAEQVDFERFEVEDLQESRDGDGHEKALSLPYIKQARSTALKSSVGTAGQQ